MLFITLLIMGLATFFVGLLPSFETIGVLAPALLVVLRFAPGFGAGGEWGGAHGRRARKEGLLRLPAAARDTGRAPALDGGLLGCLGATRRAVPRLVVEDPVPALHRARRRGALHQANIMETPSFSRVKETHTESRTPILDVFRAYPRAVLLAAGARFADNVLYYVFATFVLTCNTSQLGMLRSAALIGVLIVSGLELVPMPADAVALRPHRPAAGHRRGRARDDADLLPVLLARG